MAPDFHTLVRCDDRRLARFAAFLTAIGLGAGILICSGTAVAQAPPPDPAGRTNVLNVGPPVPAQKSPVDLFRELLGMSREERRKALADRSPEAQRQVLAKLREYEALKPSQRELRLQVTELRWYLMPLLQSPATNRAEQLASVPPDYRKRVQDRLVQWDRLPAALQKDLLDNEAAVRYFTELESSSPEQRRKVLESLSPARREKLQAGVQHWQALPADQQRKIVHRFNQFFDLTSGEKQKALATISETERRQIEKTLRSFGSLTAAQRSQCIRSFEKFASLSLEERQQFLKNAERWKLMSPDERQDWRDLVARLESAPPPLPSEVPPLPPRAGSFPPLPPRGRPAPPVATN